MTSCTFASVSRSKYHCPTPADLAADFANNCNVGYAFINFVDVS
jgi:hypothetical protein